MGDPRKQKKKFSKPKHPWRIERIEEENALSAAYGLSKKKEIWIAKEMLGGFRQQARKLLAAIGDEAEKERKDLLGKLNRLGILESEDIEDVLGLKVENILDRRLQTLVLKKGLANTAKHARQMVVHNHVQVSGRKVNVPGYLVPKSIEDTIMLDEKYAKKVAG